MLVHSIEIKKVAPAGGEMAGKKSPTQRRSDRDSQYLAGASEIYEANWRLPIITIFLLPFGSILSFSMTIGFFGESPYWLAGLACPKARG
jgi:hypothetical protein